MKAGVFIPPSHNLVYVAKGRKKGRTLLPLGNGRYAWRPCEATCTRYDNEENYRGL